MPVDLTGLPDDAPVLPGAAGVDLTGLPDDTGTVLDGQWNRSRTSPDDAASAAALSKATGLPRPVVERNRDEAQRRALKPDWQALEASAPFTVQQLVENPKLFEFARDDTENLSAVEKAVGYGQRGTAALLAAGPRFNAAFWGVAEAGADFLSTYLTGPLAGTVLPQDIGASMADTFRRYRQVQSGFADDIRRNEVDAGPGEKAVYSGLESLGLNLLALPISITTGTPGPALLTMSTSTGGLEYGKARDAGRSPTESLIYATSQAAVEYATEKLPVSRLLGDLTGGTPFWKTVLHQAAAEIPGEQLATVLQDLNEWAVINPDKPFSAYLAERPSAAAETLIATVVSVGGQTTVAKGIDLVVRDTALRLQRAEEAKQQAAALEQLSALAQASKLRARDPQTFEEFVRAATADGPVQDVYVSAEALMQSGVDPSALAQVSPAVADQVEEAIATGGDIRIPVSEFATRVAGTGLDTALLPHLKTDPGGMSAAEADAFFQQATQELQAQAQQIMAEKQADEAFQASAKVVEQSIFAQLQQANRFTPDVNNAYASLVRDFYTVTAQRLGLTPEEMFARYPLRVAAEEVAGDWTMDQREPIKLFHGTDAEFNTFDRKKARTASHIYLTDEEEVAGNYGKNVFRFSANPRNLLWLHPEDIGPAEYRALRAAFEAIGEDYGYEDFDSFFEDVTGATGALYGVKGSLQDALFDELLSQGFDAVAFPDPRVGGGWAMSYVFSDPSLLQREAEPGTNPASNLEQGGTADEDPFDLDFTRPGVRPDGDKEVLLATVGGRNAAQGWAGATRIRGADGQPAAVYRGAATALAPEHFALDAFGVASGNPSSGLGVWFTDDPDEASTFGDVEEFRLDVRNPVVYKAEELPGFDTVEEAHAWRETLREAGHDGIVIDATHLGGRRHVVVFEPAQVVRPEPVERTLFQAENQQRLAVVHNLTADNIEFADKFGGLPVPSLAVVKESMGLSGFGDITLIGNAELGDPTQVPVYDSDAYAPRVPMPDYKKAKQKDAQRLVDALRPFAAEFDDMSTLHEAWDYAINNPKPERIIEDMLRSSAAMALYLHEQGETVAPVMRPATVEAEFVEMPAFQKFLKEVGYRPAFAYDDIVYRRQLTEAVKAASYEYAASIANGDQSVAELWGESFAKNWIGSDGLVPFGYSTRIERSLAAVGRMDVDRQATREALDAKLGDRKLDFKAWVEAKVLPMFGEPRLKLRGKFVPYTIENVVKAMAGKVQNREQSMTFGAGAARAAMAKRFPSLAKMKDEAQDVMADEVQVKQMREAAEAMLEDYRNKVVEAYNGRDWRGNVDTWHALDASMRALARLMKGAKTPENLRRALRAEDFDVREISDEALELGVDAAQAMYAVAVPYFEAKPQRAVKLSEFRGAVVPAKTPAKVLDILKRHGIAVRVYDSGAGPTAQIQATVELRRELAQQGENVLFQGAAPRGKISFGADITASPTTITLLRNADLSTFLHESGHFFLEVLTDIAARPDAPPEIVADMNRLLAWFGVPDLATWQGMTLDEKRASHEQFARGFEAYLFEGRAPNVEVQGLFSRFRAWLINVYRSLSALNVELTDEVRGVFDRMLATDEQIKAAEQSRGFAPLFKAAEEAGLDPKSWEEYQRLGAQATEEAVGRLQRRSLRDMQWLQNARGRELRRLQQAAAEKRKSVRAEVEAELYRDPVYAAWRFLANGILPEGEKVTGAKLSLDALKEMYGTDPAAPWRYLPVGKHGLAGTEGMHPDQVAELFGLGSGDELVRKLLAADPPRVAIEALTDQRMLERYGDLSSPDAMEKAADEAIHNSARARFVATELAALTQAKGKASVLARAAKAFAERMIAGRKVRDIRPAQHAAAEARAARAAEKATKAGNLVLAATEKRNQLVNTYAARTAYRALDEIDKGLNYLRKFGREGTRKGLDAAYLDQIDQLLERFDLRAGVTNAELRRRTSLAKWVESQREAGFEPQVSEDLLNEARRQHYRDLTLEEFRGLLDAVKNIEHLGRLKKKLLTAKDQREFAERVTEAAETIRENARGTVKEQRASDRGPLVGLSRWFAKFTADHRKFASLMRQFDGFKDGGPLWELFVRPMNEAGDFEASRREKATVDLSRLFEPILKTGKLAQKTFIPQISRSLTREERIGVALNMGNEVNRERVLTGEKWTPAQLQAVLATLTQEEWNFVQGVWDYFESFRPEIGEKQKRVTGVEPEWVQAQPVETKFGTLRGGYYPIKYDPLRSSRAEADTAADVQRQMERGLYTRAMTRRGHLEARVESTGRPLRYDLGVVVEHVNQVVHDLAWHEFLIDADRLLRADAIDGAIREHYGPAVLRTLKDLMTDIAVGDVPAASAWEQFITHVRYGATIAGLGWNLTTAALQPLGISQSIVRIGPTWVARGMGKWLGSAARMENKAAWIYERSEFMRLRGKTLQREINEIRNKVAGKSSAVEASYFWLIQKLQLVADVPTWLGAYEKAMAEPEMTEAKAIALADQAVIDSQGGGQIKDLAAIQRGSPLMKLWTNFYSYFSVTYNLAAERTRATRFNKPLDVARLAIDYLLLTVIPATLGALIRAAMKGEVDDEEKLAEQIARENANYLFGLMIGLREFGAAVQGFSGYTGPGGIRFFSEITKLGKQVEQGEVDEALLRSLNNVGGIMFHYPAGQVQRTAEGIAALANGESANPGVLLAGPPRN